MPSFLWPAFSNGILGPGSYGRVDIQGYARAAKDILNFIVDIRGGLVKRPGTWNIPTAGGSRTITSASWLYDPERNVYRVKLIPFVFEIDETRLLVFIPGKFYVFKFNYDDRNNGVTQSAIPIYVTEGDHDYQTPNEIKYAQINDVLYLAHPDHTFKKLMRTGTKYSPYDPTDPTTAIDEPQELYSIKDVDLGLYLSANPSGLGQSEYTLDMGGSHKIPMGWPIIYNSRMYNGVSPVGAGTKTVMEYTNIWPSSTNTGNEAVKPVLVAGGECPLGFDGAWDCEAWHKEGGNQDSFWNNNIPPDVLQRATEANVKNPDQSDSYRIYYVVQPDIFELQTRITSGKLVFIEDDGKVKKECTILGSRNWVAEVDNGSDQGQFVFTLIAVRNDNDMPGNEPGGSWYIKSATYTNAGYGVDIHTPGSNNPRAVAVHEQRLWVAGTTNEPSAIWASAVRDYENFRYDLADDEELKDSDPLKFVIAASNQDPIYWLQSANARLFAGTSETVYILQGDPNKGITPSSIKITADSHIGTKNQQPLAIADVLIAPYRTGQQLQMLGYNFSTDSFQSLNLNLLCESVTRPGILSMAWQQEPFQTIWVVMKDGTVGTYTIDLSTQEGGTRAWARHVTPGGRFLDVCTLPYVGRYSYDCPFFLVDRDDNLYLEYMPLDRGFWNQAVVDACQSLPGEGMVEIIDGIPTGYPAREPSSLDNIRRDPPPYMQDWAINEVPPLNATAYEYGFNIPARLETLPADVYDQPHSYLGLKKKRPGTVFVRVMKTWDLIVNGYDIFSRIVWYYGYSKAKLLNGILRWDNWGWTHEGKLEIIHNTPFPCSILNVGFRMDVGADD